VSSRLPPSDFDHRRRLFEPLVDPRPMDAKRAAPPTNASRPEPTRLDFAVEQLLANLRDGPNFADRQPR
jgi:hypothetical protein